MTDPDERIINRALMYLEGTTHLDYHRENAREALHRIFRNTRRLENELEMLQACADALAQSYAAERETVERMREQLLNNHLRDRAENDRFQAGLDVPYNAPVPKR